jgi:hypothetical protein
MDPPSPLVQHSPLGAEAAAAQACDDAAERGSLGAPPRLESLFLRVQPRVVHGRQHVQTPPRRALLLRQRSVYAVHGVCCVLGDRVQGNVVSANRGSVASVAVGVHPEELLVGEGLRPRHDGGGG